MKERDPVTGKMKVAQAVQMKEIDPITSSDVYGQGQGGLPSKLLKKINSYVIKIIFKFKPYSYVSQKNINKSIKIRGKCDQLYNFSK